MRKTDLSPHQRRKLQEFLVLFDRSSTEDKGEEEGDPEFVRATQEFQKRYRVQDVLSEGADGLSKRESAHVMKQQVQYNSCIECIEVDANARPNREAAIA